MSGPFWSFFILTITHNFKTADAAAPTFTLLVSKFYFKNAKVAKSSKIENNKMEMIYEIAKVLVCQNRFV